MFFQFRKQVIVIGCQVGTIGWVGDNVPSKLLQESDSLTGNVGASVVVENAYALARLFSSPILNHRSSRMVCSAPSRLSRGKLTVSRFFLRCEFQYDQLQTPYTTCGLFDIHARLAIHFRQLAMNFYRFNAFCVQEPNNCANFALGGNAKREFHYKRLPNQD